jgi:hypothetical protein
MLASQVQAKEQPGGSSTTEASAAKRAKHTEKETSVTEPTVYRTSRGAAPVRADYGFDTVFNISRQISTSNGYRSRIDVIPDSRPFIYCTSRVIRKNFSNLDFTASEHLTPPSLLAYCLSLFYGFILLNDMNDHFEITFHAAAFEANALNQRFINLLKQCPVPDFMAPVLEHLQPYRNELKPNLVFTPSLNTFLFEHDFGRVIPITVLLLAHNSLITTRLPARLSNNDSASANYLHRWLLRPIVNFTGAINQEPANNHSVRIGNIIGSLYQGTNGPELFDNWFSSELSKHANPITIRSARRSLYQYHLRPANYALYSSVDPYEYVFGLNAENRREILTFIDGMRTNIRSLFPSSKVLSEYIQPGKYEIACHTITTYPPLYCNGTIIPQEAANVVDGSEANLLAATHFQQEPPAPNVLINLHNINSSNRQCQTGTAPTEALKDTKMLLFDPKTADSHHHSFTIASGKNISNGDVDRTLILLPDPRFNLAFNSSRFFASAIPCSSIHTEISTSPRVLRYRATENSRFHRKANIILDIGSNLLPNFLSNAEGYAEGRNIPNFCFLWSSYRTTPNGGRPTRSNTMMLASLEPIFGTQSCIHSCPILPNF